MRLMSGSCLNSRGCGVGEWGLTSSGFHKQKLNRKLNSEGLSYTLKRQKLYYSSKVCNSRTDQNHPASLHRCPLNSQNSPRVKNAFELVKKCHRDENQRLHPQLKALLSFAMTLESHREVSRICGNLKNCNS